ncbi:hypothetical protein DICPUDRAFT_73856 [Dictyostelium purpureum]|uniref:Uncharacterized protein n=1 Tax=Dictyostelium purpureum TaxID=5786 RepID=F0Z627_DICPU|nr:uncharacterized protein DICPUDRAFT_73856 [Dictyostelium purpureum]EGC40528.1 hypothetical protein DICPUDRAFT_73856 [Dictyostelium purpureum]|eukprot:XP_003282864.1 hypothetical protein DICPUDRAFT_73856 [Dictyostelium purpureum]
MSGLSKDYIKYQNNTLEDVVKKLEILYKDTIHELKAISTAVELGADIQLVAVMKHYFIPEINKSQGKKYTVQTFKISEVKVSYDTKKKFEDISQLCKDRNSVHKYIEIINRYINDVKIVNNLYPESKKYIDKFKGTVVKVFHEIKSDPEFIQKIIKCTFTNKS